MSYITCKFGAIVAKPDSTVIPGAFKGASFRTIGESEIAAQMLASARAEGHRGKAPINQEKPAPRASMEGKKGRAVPHVAELLSDGVGRTSEQIIMELTSSEWLIRDALSLMHKAGTLAYDHRVTRKWTLVA